MKRIILIIGICAALAVPITMFRNAIEQRINHETTLRTQAESDAIKAKEEAQLKEAQIKELQKNKEDLEKQLQSKREEQTRLAQEQKQQVAKPAVAISGTCDQWIRDAGIADIGNANELIRRESRCNPHAVNKSSGACGIAQELPCGKSGCKLGDGACQVKWMNTYVVARYKTWAGAINWHDKNGWY